LDDTAVVLKLHATPRNEGRRQAAIVEQDGAGIPLQQCGEVQLFTADEGGGHAGVEMSKREGAKKTPRPPTKRDAAQGTPAGKE
jgi:hypothetical protein